MQKIRVPPGYSGYHLLQSTNVFAAFFALVILLGLLDPAWIIGGTVIPKHTPGSIYDQNNIDRFSYKIPTITVEFEVHINRFTHLYLGRGEREAPHSDRHSFSRQHLQLLGCYSRLQ